MTKCGTLTTGVALCMLLRLGEVGAAGAEPLFTENFNGYIHGHQNAAQLETNLRLSVGGELPAWQKVGQGTIHAVDRTGAGDYAPMVWVDNVITLSDGVAANNLGTRYLVELDIGPTVYATSSQTTADGDGVVIDVLRGDGSELASFPCRPGAWKGRQNFQSVSFQYQGDGSGAVRFRVRPLASPGRFGGAIDNLSVSAQTKGAEHFDKVIAPLLSQHCLQCHTGGGAKGNLDLSRFRRAMAGGDSGAPLVPGDPDASLLWQRIDANEMPPKHALAAAEKQRVKDWIRDGAPWGQPTIDPFQFSTDRRAGYDWWALKPLRPVQPPPVQEPGNEPWGANEIDSFILATLKEHGLSPSPRAQPRTLVRRLYIDLIGLPPATEVVDRFEKDPTDAAWEKLVDELLASPQYGERWGRHWLDVVRFGETNGYEYNEPREDAWRYRDWMIQALNADMPYDQFAQMQLAGDVLKPQSLEGSAAAGFLVAGVHNTILGVNPAMKQAARQDELEELTGTVTQTFLGLTANCARCHDHKFDPIGTEEYYRLTAALVGVNHGVRQARDERGKDVPVYTVVSGTPGPTRVLTRGDVLSPGKEVAPGGLRAVYGIAADFGLTGEASDAQRRLKLAQWISDSNSGPFHRVIVNRVWHYHFGKGIVETPSDFGFNGGRPSHPELLDWLAVWFRDHGRSLKKLHKLIVTSATYRQASTSHAEAAKVDSGNRFLWRQNSRRVEAEVLRDSMLSAAGELNLRQFGRGYRDVKIVEVLPTRYYIPINPAGPEFDRRTIYRWNARGQRSALLDTFDCPDPSAQAPKRSVTTTPSQALSLWNDSFVLRMSEKLAERVDREVAAPNAKQDDSTEKIAPQVDHAWRIVLGRLPGERERVKAIKLVRDHGLALLCRVLLNSNEFILVD